MQSGTGRLSCSRTALLLLLLLFILCAKRSPHDIAAIANGYHIHSGGLTPEGLCPVHSRAANDRRFALSQTCSTNVTAKRLVFACSKFNTPDKSLVDGVFFLLLATDYRPNLLICLTQTDSRSLAVNYATLSKIGEWSRYHSLFLSTFLPVRRSA